ncbi:DNA topoisomerase 2-alpha [Bagarius yarrelli]|uniref:DNA topoisomerase 2 n=1 Tax=Bagarius yarrelli TaxID=175774 RepID=A0A556VVT1_BAGYA|nr:DNA topoisomerase 2-alpha [Bagarius yarrelli]
MATTDGPLKTLFENKVLSKPKKDDKRLSVERIYQKKTQLEHILLRPDTYIGSVEPVTQQMWVFDDVVGMNNRDITFVPGLYKIFDEILVNAADNKQRDSSMNCIKITIDPENTTISIWNNGKGIPVVEHKVEKVYVPALIFGQLLTSSNYDDDQKKVTGGRNGYGAKLCNIFSTKFTVETACRESKQCFKQTWYDNMGRAGEVKIKPFSGDDFTCVTFQPDLSKFKMKSLDRDTVALLTRRAYDIAGSTKGVKVFLNGTRLPVSGFRSYVDLYMKDRTDETGSPLTVVHEMVNPRWEVCLTMSEKGFQQVSFVNSIATTKGGRHTDYVADQIVSKMIEVVKKKNKGGVAVKPFQVKNHMWLFVNCLIENPSFDSQTKENMTLQQKSFGSTCTLSEKFIKQANSCGVVESVMNWVKFKAQTQLNKKCSAVKHTKIKGVPKLDDANDAGGKNSGGCTLILTEGDSAKTLAVSGLGVVGRDRYGVFPLRGKMLNVREASHKQIMENAEINNIIKILGLQYRKNYSDPESLKTLRYGRLMIMTDQDQDGSHIKGLLINFIHHNWPSLLHHNFLEEFITPIIKASNKKQSFSFYSIPEFSEWKDKQSNLKSWKIKYYKGLGTSTAQEAKEYFSDMARHRIPFKYSGPADDEAITLAFSKKKVEERKEWLTSFMINRRQRREHNLPELPSYKGFKGTIEELAANQYMNSGEVAIIDSTTIEISELPVKTWTQAYKENVLEVMLNGSEKVPALITDYKEYHTDSTVRFVVKMSEERLREAEAAGLHKVFKLQNPLTCNSMVLFDHVGSLKKYDMVQDIIKDFFELRLKYYVLRKDWLLGMLGAESAKLSNQARFILEKISGSLVIENKPKKELIRMLQEMGYDSDPVKAWKESQEKDVEEGADDEDEEKEKGETSGPDYNYLLSMPMWFLTKEKKDELCRQRDEKMNELSVLKRKSPSDLWKEDLAAFTEELERVEQAERAAQGPITQVKIKGGRSKVVKMKDETMPTPQGRRVIPRITSAMKDQAVKKGGAKKAKIKSESDGSVVMKMEFGDEDAGDSQEMGLAARLTKKVKKEPKEKASKSGKQTTLHFKPVKKNHPWTSDEEESEDDDSGASTSAPRERIGRKANTGVKYCLSESEDESSNWGSLGKKKTQVIDDDDDDDDDDDMFVPEPSALSESEHDSPVRPPPQAKRESCEESNRRRRQETHGKAKKTTAVSKKKATASDVKQPSILDALSKPATTKKSTANKPITSSESETSAPAAVAKKAPVRKRKVIASSEDSDSDSDAGNLMARLKGKAAEKKSKPGDDNSFSLELTSAAVAPRSKTARNTKPINYMLDSDSDDDF